MKKVAYLISAVLIITLVSIFGFQANATVSGNNFNRISICDEVADESIIGNDPLALTTINQFDSVFFDLYNVTMIGTLVEFPVYIRSDDVINALDFAFKYDHSQLEYDTIINLTTYIDDLSFYNTNDSTVRLTSYSFTQPYSVDTPLFIVRFNVLAGYACIDDFNSTTALLNGDLSSHRFEQCQFTGINDEEFDALKMFPNPAGYLMVIESPVETDLQIMDLQGQKIGATIKVDAGKATYINTSEMANGIYFLGFSHEGNGITRKFVVNH